MNREHIHCHPQPHRILNNSYLECTLLQDPWEQSNNLHIYVTMDTWESTYVNDCGPHLLAAKSAKSKYNSDNPSYTMAMRGPFQAEYYEAMEIELKTLSQVMKCWDLIPCTPT